MPHLFQGPEAWRGSALWQRQNSCLQLDHTANKELRRVLRLANQEGQPAEQMNSSTLSVFRREPLASYWQRACQELENGAGVVRIRGLDMDGLSDADCAILFWGIAHQLGIPVSQSAEGALLFRVEDRGFAIGQKKARGPNTRAALSFHTDRCDVIGFFCVRQAAHGGDNLLASSAAIHNAMLQDQPNLLSELYQPYLWLRHSIDTGNRQPWCSLPIFAPFRGRFMANIMRVLIERGHNRAELPDLTQRQRQALDAFEHTARQATIHTRIRQEPGELLFLNNLVVVHARDEFEDTASTSKRLLLRVWLATPYSRELHPVYGQLYGTCAAGAVRGGIHPAN